MLGGAGADVLEGGAGADYLDGGAGNDSLNGGEGNDALVAGAGNDTLTGGDGLDVFVYSAGKDVITDYNPADGDYISIPSGSVSASTISGGDVILTVGSKGTITIKNAKNSEITVANATSTVNGIFGYYSYERAGGNKVNSITLNADFAGSLNATMYASTVTTIDATNATEDIVIYGNANANTIIGSSKNEAETIFAGDGADSVVATGGNEVVLGEAGNDSIETGEGNDSILGGDGNDVITAGDGDNTVLGGAGNDQISAGAGSDYVDAGEGNDYIDAGAGNDSLYGGAGNDVIMVTSGDNILSGGAGADSLVGGTGSDSFYGGDGNDTILYTGGDDFIYDYKNVSGEMDVILLNGGTVTSSELDGDNVVLNVENSEGTGGSLTIQNAKNSAIKVGTFDGTTADIRELIYGYFVYDSTDANNPAITLNADFEGTLPASLYPANTKTIDATKVNTTSNEPLVVYGNAQSNTILGSTIMANVIYGDSNSDYLVGGNDGDTLSGGAGNDSLEGGAGDDLLLGGLGKDTLDGGAGDDTFTGGEDVDTFIYTSGDDVITDYEASKDIIRFDSATITVKGSAITNDSDVTITMTDGSHEGSITVKNGKDKKIILTDIGNDDFGKGAIYGYYSGVGEESITLNSDFAGKSFAAKTYDTNITAIDATLLEDGINISITANDSATAVIGSENNDSVLGGKGEDSLVGNGGEDYLVGGAGADTLEGGEGNDRLVGDAGNDVLIGGAGTDTLTGGAGSDTFIYTGESDVITDYEAGKDNITISDAVISSSTINGSDLVLDMGGGTITVKNGKDKALTIVNGEDTITGIYGYYDGVGEQTITVNSAYTGTEITAKMYSGVVNGDETVTVNAIDATQITKGITIYGNTATGTSIKSGEGNDTLIGTANDDTLIGGDGSNVIIGTGGNNWLESGNDGTAIITGGTGSDTLIATDGSNTLSGGAGSDTFLFVGGNATITDYTTGADQIHFSVESASVESSNVIGEDVVLNIGAKGTILVQNARGKALTIVNDESGDSDSRVFGYFDYELIDDGAAITLNADYPNADVRDAIYGELVTTIYASQVDNGLAIYANSNESATGTYIVGTGFNDLLVGAAGKSDTLVGGDGNDTLTGTSGNNFFIHTGGNDVITDYTYEDSGRQDTIQLSDSTVQSATVKDKDVIITTTGGGTITVKNAKDKPILILGAGEDSVGPRIYGYYDLEGDNYVKLNEDFTGTFNAANSAPEAITVDGTAVAANITIQSGHVEGGNNIFMIGGEGNDKIIAGNNGDSMMAYEGSDTLVGGAGNDFYLLQLEDVINNCDDWHVRHSLEREASHGTVDGSRRNLHSQPTRATHRRQITVKNAKNSELDALLRRRDGRAQTRTSVALQLRQRYIRLIREQRAQWLSPLSTDLPPKFDRMTFTATSMAIMATAYAVYQLDLENSVVYGVDWYGNIGAIQCSSRAARAMTCRTLNACGVPRVDWTTNPYIELEAACDPFSCSGDNDEG